MTNDDVVREARSVSCADAPGRVMPNPFYVGSAFNTTVMFPLMTRDNDRQPSDGERLLGRFVLPPFQRPPVWSREQQVRLIESIWLELPIGAFVYNTALRRNVECDQWLIDGQQRITALISYVRGDFPVFGWRYPDLGEIDQRFFQQKSFPCIELQEQPRDRLKGIYDRLAFGGTPHDLAARSESEDTQAKPTPTQADVDALVEAGQGALALFRRPDEGDIEYFDRKAMQFYSETGIWPPGKSAPMHVEECDDAHERFRGWHDQKAEAIRAALKPFQKG